jgi:hypothetical protein
MDKPTLSNQNVFGLFVQHYESYLPFVFDDNLTLLEKVNKIIIYLNQIGKLSNNVLDQWNQVMEWVMADGLNGSVDEKLNAMVADGTLDTIINHNIFNELSTKVDANTTAITDQSSKLTQDEAKLSSQQTDIDSLKTLTSSHTTSINSLTTQQSTQDQSITDVKATQHIQKGNTFGTFDNAALQSVMANNPDAVPQVLGISLSNDQVLATYDARDTVASYRANFSRKATLEVDNVTYATKSVTVPSTIDLSSVKVGMIIDTKHSPKYSGLITAINGKTITVNNWYQMGNTAKGQVPTGSVGIYIDPVTHVWVDNVNLTLNDGDPDTGATIVEYGMFNNQYDGGIRNGIQMISLGDHIPDTAYNSSSSGQNNKWQCGFKDKNSITAFGSENPNEQEALVFNSSTGYKIKNHGEMNRLKLTVANSGNGTLVNPHYSPIFIITTATPHTIVAANQCGGDMCFIKNNTGSDVSVGALTIPANAISMVFSDGAYWYIG